jgi:Domain of unknown function (DUF4349)/Putative zinc-finger
MPINTHPFTPEEVMAYLDGELAAESAAEMAAHLAQCRACQDNAADLQGVSRQLASWVPGMIDTDDIPLKIAAALDARAASEVRRHGSFWDWRFVGRHPGVALVAAIVVLIVGAGFVSRFRTNHFVASRTMSLAADSYEPTPAAEPVTSEAKMQTNVSLIARTAQLRLTALHFDSFRVDLDRILRQAGGHIAEIVVRSPTGEARHVDASLRIPAPQLEISLSELRKLGSVTSESEGGEEVTKQSVDIEARLANARHTEERLTEILRTRTGKLSEALEVEGKLAEIRGRIEQAEAEQKTLNNRVSFATVSVSVTEDYRAGFSGAALSVGSRLSNAAVEGVHTAFDGLVGLMQTLLAIGPSVLLFGFVIGLPAYFLWRKLRH